MYLCRVIKTKTNLNPGGNGYQRQKVMKTSIKTIMDGVAHDNRESILENGGNVAEYILNSTECADQGWFEFLSDDEISEYENASAERRHEIRNEIRNFVNENYNYNLRSEGLMKKWIVVKFIHSEDDILYVTRRDNFEEMNMCDAYTEYGQTVGCENAGCYAFSNSESSIFLDFSKALYEAFDNTESIVDENEMTDKELCELFTDEYNHNAAEDLFGSELFEQMQSFFKA